MVTDPPTHTQTQPQTGPIAIHCAAAIARSVTIANNYAVHDYVLLNLNVYETVSWQRFVLSEYTPMLMKYIEYRGYSPVFVSVSLAIGRTSAL